MPVIFCFAADSTTISSGAHDLPDHRGQNRFHHRNIEDNPWTALVVADVASTDPWTPCGTEFRGRAEVNKQGGERLAPSLGQST